jgi:hypothetical protein
MNDDKDVFSKVFGYMELGLIFRLARIYVERVAKLV